MPLPLRSCLGARRVIWGKLKNVSAVVADFHEFHPNRTQSTVILQLSQAQAHE
jgi:hypothetical protein